MLARSVPVGLVADPADGDEGRQDPQPFTQVTCFSARIGRGEQVLVNRAEPEATDLPQCWGRDRVEHIERERRGVRQLTTCCLAAG
jgi:hypothetical protein